MILFAILVGVLSAHATNRLIDGTERSAADLMVAKDELLASAGLTKLHNEIYTKVGEARWERDVKPTFMSAITWATVYETGDLLPSWRQVVDWTRAHPQEARRMLENAATIP